MATGRTLARHTRIYANGYDFSTYIGSVGPLKWSFEEADNFVALADEVRGALMGQASIDVGVLNGVFDNTATSGLHVRLNSPGSALNLMVAIGQRTAPAEGDVAFVAAVMQRDYETNPNEPLITVSIPLSRTAVNDLISYDTPWGKAVLPKATKTAVNSAVGFDDGGVQTTKGGYMMYQLFTANGTGTVTMDVQDASTNTNPSFSSLVSSGAINASAAPTSDIVELATTATVERYLRWQIAFGGDTTSVTLALAFVRGR